MRLPAGARNAAADSLGFVSEASSRFGERGTRLLEAAQQSFVDGVGAAFLVGAGVLALGAFAVLLRGPRAARSARPAAPPAQPVGAHPGR